jgi:subtilisin family serine protease
VVGVSPAILAAKVRVADTTQRDAVAAALSRDPGVASVGRNRLIWLDETFVRSDGSAGAAAAAPRATPNDPLYPLQAWHYGIIDLPRAWGITTGSASVLVAVVDDGIRFDHPAIAANLTADGYDFVSAADSLSLCAGGQVSNAADGDTYDPDPTIPASYSLDATGTCYAPDTLGGHGLHVAGTIGAVGNDGLGVSGVNWAIRIRSIRTLGAGGFGGAYDIAQGILYAAGLPADDGHGSTVRPSTAARIINLSLGGPGDDPVLHDAIISAASAGALIVAAAGNDGSSDLVYPAAYPEVLAVAAVGPDGAPAPYSNFGSYVGIRAPGGDFGLGDVTDGVTSTMWDFARGAPEYVIAEGTSMAAPHVTGVAALLLAHEPALTAAELRSRLTDYAVGPASAYGAGLVDAYNSLSQTFGPPSQPHARLYAVSGAIVQTVAAQAGGAFAFTDVPDGSYFVYGGTDEAGDGQVGVPGRLWGAFGTLAAPRTVSVLGRGPYPASFAIGLPTQLEPNHSIPTASPLMIGGYVQGVIDDANLLDVYRITVPQAGIYTFETSGWVGACGFALEQATAIGLFDAAGNLLSVADFLDRTHFNFCARLTRGLSRTTYYVAVAGAFNGGRYRLQAREGQ